MGMVPPEKAPKRWGLGEKQNSLVKSTVYLQKFAFSLLIYTGLS